MEGPTIKAERNTLANNVNLRITLSDSSTLSLIYALVNWLAITSTLFAKLENNN